MARSVAADAPFLHRGVASFCGVAQRVRTAMSLTRTVEGNTLPPTTSFYLDRSLLSGIFLQLKFKMLELDLSLPVPVPGLFVPMD